MHETIPDELSNTNPEERNFYYLQSSSNYVVTQEHCLKLHCIKIW